MSATLQSPSSLFFSRGQDTEQVPLVGGLPDPAEVQGALLDYADSLPRTPNLVWHDGDRLRSRELKRGENVHIGRGLSCEVRLDSTWVSSRHAVICLQEDGSACLMDNRSLNGTWLEGERVGSSPRPLQGRSMLSLGGWPLLVSLP